MTALALPGGVLGGISRRELTLWSGAALVVVSLHAAGGWYLGRQAPIELSAPPAENAIMIDLPPMAVAPEAVPLDAADLVDSTASETPEQVTEQIKPIEPEAAEPTIGIITQGCACADCFFQAISARRIVDFTMCSQQAINFVIGDDRTPKLSFCSHGWSSTLTAHGAQQK